MCWGIEFHSLGPVYNSVDTGMWCEEVHLGLVVSGSYGLVVIPVCVHLVF